MFVPYLQLLHDHAFDNYASLLQEVTLSPSMGHFLDMANNEKANTTPGTAPNENYARELLQLFTIGTDRLNADGTPQLDGRGPADPDLRPDGHRRHGARVDRLDVSRPGPARRRCTRNPLYFVGRMEPVPASHDPGEKSCSTA